MKKLLALTIGIVFLLSGCANISNNSNQTSSEESFENIVEKYSVNAQNIEEYIEKGDIDLENILDDDEHLIVVLQDNIIINDKESNKTKFIKYDGANSIGISRNKLYFFNSDKSAINSLDLKTYEIETQYSSASPIQNYYCIGNGNLIIETEDYLQSIYNPDTNKNYDILDSDAYIGTDYHVDDNRTGIYINDKHLENEEEYIADTCKIGDSLYYITLLNNDITAIVKLSAETYKKSTFLQIDTSDNNGFISECPKALYDYNSRLFLFVGINQKYDSSSDYERGELWQLDLDGKIKKKYKFNEIPDSSTFTFYDGKFFYYDVNEKLNSIDL